MRVLLHPDAERDLSVLPVGERVAMDHAFEKLRLLGDRLGPPHSSAVKGVASTLRELRPRGGRSPWRAFYRRTGDALVIGAIGPEANVNELGFRRAVREAIDRLDSINSDHF